MPSATAVPVTPPSKTRIVDNATLRSLVERHGAPLFVYDTALIAERIDALRAFDVVRYAQKANSNLSLLRWIQSQGVRVDAVSAGEVHRALCAGFDHDEIDFTADLFDHTTLRLLVDHDLHVNLGSADMIEQYATVRPGGKVTLRVNPGFGHGHDLKVNTGGPQSKHGIWFEQLPAAVARARRAGLTVTGVHMHIGSGSDFKHLSRVRHAMERAALDASETLTSFSTGGGLPIPYRPGEDPFDAERYAADWTKTKVTLEQTLGRPLSMEVEPGRFLVAESGMLITEVRAIKESGGIAYILVDAGFDNLLRPAMYGAYHHISVLGRDHEPHTPRAVAGPLCESADLFTQGKGGLVEPRPLPNAQVGDLVCLHDTGAYAASMASNYNGRRFAAEVMIEDGAPRLVRRRQTFDELMATEIDFLG